MVPLTNNGQRKHHTAHSLSTCTIWRITSIEDVFSHHNNVGIRALLCVVQSSKNKIIKCENNSYFHTILIFKLLHLEIINIHPRWKLGFRRFYIDFQLLASFLTIFSQINRAVWDYQRRFTGGFDKLIIYSHLLLCACKDTNFLRKNNNFRP